MTDIPAVDLGRGVAMPMVGFGTWQLHGELAYEAIRHALQAGYRHIDTATMYRNEEQVGRALADSRLDRADVFITTKLPPGSAGRARITIAESLKALGTTWTCGWCTGRPAAATWFRCGGTSSRSGTRA
jgi:diketogulonate reductase-like aldo/keto reductase